jgi:integrase
MEDQVRQYRDAYNTLGEASEMMTVDQIVEFITKKEEQFQLDFIHYGREVVGEMEATGRAGAAENYRATLNTICKFTGKSSLDIAEITSSFLKDFLKWLDTRPAETKRKKGTRARSLYTGIIRTLHNKAKEEYNDEDRGIINIPFSPFKKFKIPKDIPPPQRALSLDVIKAIFNLPYMGGARFDLAKDLFVLSFGLVGMNSVDLYGCTCFNEGRIDYNRTKTASRRTDFARTSVKVDERIMPLVQKYKDMTNERVFCFYKDYSTRGTFSAAINKGLKQIGELKEIGVPDLQLYAARHSWATIAVNDARVDKYTVHMGLNHADPQMKVTDIYIKKDFSLVDEANKKVLDLVYGNTTRRKKK